VPLQSLAPLAGERVPEAKLRAGEGFYFSSNLAPGGVGTSKTFKVTDTKE
jgi:hypothetical protein